MREFLSGIILIALNFFSIYYRSVSEYFIAQMHPYSEIEYSASTFYLQAYLHSAPVFYLVVTTIIKPDLRIYKSVLLMHFYLIFAFLMALDNYLYYHFKIVNLDVWSVSLIVLTFFSMGRKIYFDLWS